jgi:hypothetical protein
MSSGDDYPHLSEQERWVLNRASDDHLWRLRDRYMSRRYSHRDGTRRFGRMEGVHNIEIVMFIDQILERRGRPARRDAMHMDRLPRRMEMVAEENMDSRLIRSGRSRRQRIRQMESDLVTSLAVINRRSRSRRRRRPIVISVEGIPMQIDPPSHAPSEPVFSPEEYAEFFDPVNEEQELLVPPEPYIPPEALNIMQNVADNPDDYTAEQIEQASAAAEVVMNNIAQFAQRFYPSGDSNWEHYERDNYDPYNEDPQ